MKEITKALLQNKNKTVPILTFPSAQLLDISVKELISSAQMQAEGMEAIYKRCPIGAALNMMDLSVEAEAFGARIRIYEDEIPAVESGIIDDICDAEDIVVPQVGAGRTGIYIDGIRKAKERITDVPVFCGVIGPYSLAGRLFDMSELMLECYDSPDEVKVLLEKCAEFIVAYIKAYKEAGADGVVMAEPAAGLLSPALAEEFSTVYVQKIIEQVNDPDFVFCYHNCGSAASDMMDAFAKLDADIFHFGNVVDIEKACRCLPKDKIIMGNVDPVLLRTGTPETVASDTQRVYDLCNKYENFMISTGCDVPAASSWENIDAYFSKVTELYA
ncbi:MAG: methyltransferase [Ruminococcaceae bacterium]|nr:methyltransferase [Oscillospiraceae bacterium]